MTTDRDDMTPRQRLTWLSNTLALSDESQDWGITNADAERLDEFVRFMEDTELETTEVFQLMGLILASANDRLLADPRADLEAVATVLARNSQAKVHEDYWRSLEDSREFPIGAWLRARDVE